MFSLKETTHAKRSRNVLAYAMSSSRRQRFDINLVFSQLGEQMPHFSATVSARSFGGCHHELILKNWPEAKCIVDLHLCDGSGAPMHTVANGLFHAQVYLNQVSKPHYPMQKGRDYVASHFRISLDETDELLLDLAGQDESYQRLVVEAFVEKQRPRWQQEADAALAFLRG